MEEEPARPGSDSASTSVSFTSASLNSHMYKIEE